MTRTSRPSGSAAPLMRAAHPTRRALLCAGWSGVLALSGVRATAKPAAAAASVPVVDPAAAARSLHFPFGPLVPARPAVAWPIVTHLGRHTDFASLLRGHVTALQLMFTGCSATCPIQGALFAQAQRDLQWPAASTATAQFVSLTIDPLSDNPAALAAWLRQFGARAGWTAVTPRPDDLAAIRALLTEGGEPLTSDRQDPHTGQVYLFDATGQLVYRLPSMPSPKAIDDALLGVARRG